MGHDALAFERAAKKEVKEATELESSETGGSTAPQEVARNRSVAEVDTHNQQREAGIHILAEAADSRLPAAEARDTAAGSSKYMPAKVSEHSSMPLSILFSGKDRWKRPNKPCVRTGPSFH